MGFLLLVITTMAHSGDVGVHVGRIGNCCQSAHPVKEEALMPTRNVNLTDHYDTFIETSIATGRFSNASEAVRAGLHLLERQEAEDRAKIEWLRGTTREAFAELDRGEGVALSSADDIDALVNSAIKDGRAARRRTHA
jgi:antitoxin ParD1/3/4